MTGATHLDVLRGLKLPLALYVPLTLTTTAVALRGDEVHPIAVAPLFAIGYLCWSLSEYWLHRTILHMLPRGRVRRYLAGRHIMHHRDPNGHPGIALLWVSSTVAVAVFAALFATFGVCVASAIMAGIITGYLSYEYTHLASHLDTVPMTPWGAALRRHHLSHHERSARHNFAIVLPMWDWLFHTQLHSHAKQVS